MSLYRLNKTGGLFITHICPGGPAEKAGLKAANSLVDFNGTKYSIGGNDQILKVDNRSTTNVTNFISYLNQKQVGDKIKLTVLRNDSHPQIRQAYLTVAARPEFFEYKNAEFGIDIHYPQKLGSSASFAC